LPILRAAPGVLQATALKFRLQLVPMSCGSPSPVLWSSQLLGYWASAEVCWSKAAALAPAFSGLDVQTSGLCSMSIFLCLAGLDTGRIMYFASIRCWVRVSFKTHRGLACLLFLCLASEFSVQAADFRSSHRTGSFDFTCSSPEAGLEVVLWAVGSTRLCPLVATAPWGLIPLYQSRHRLLAGATQFTAALAVQQCLHVSSPGLICLGCRCGRAHPVRHHIFLHYFGLTLTISSWPVLEWWDLCLVLWCSVYPCLYVFCTRQLGQ